MIETGITLSIPNGYVFIIKPKSSHAFNYGIDVLAGIIDSDYKGTIKVILINHGSKTFNITKGMKIAQGLFVQYFHASNCNYIKDSNFNHVGFGSTGEY